MRNLKRALSLALASVMLLGMMVVGTSASYTDVDSKDNLEAIEVLKLVGVMTGDDKGNFNPDKMVTRNEMAVVMCNLLGLKTGGSHPFTDVPAWAAPYVAACYNNGIIAGVGANKFGGDANVTAVQAGLMVMKALGYFGYAGEFGDSWKLSVVKQADKINLYDGINAYTDQIMTRNEIAQMVLNALECTVQVVTEQGGVSVDGNGISVNVKPTYDYQDAANNSGKDYGGGNVRTMQLCEKIYGNDLKKDTSNNTTDAFGRPATKWTYKDTTIKSPKAASVTYLKEVKLKDIYKDLGLSSALAAGNVKFVVEGAASEAGTDNSTPAVALSTLGLSDSASNKIGGKGTVIEVYYDRDAATDKAVITIYNYYLAKATENYDTTDKEVDVNVYVGGSAVNATLKAEDFAVTGVKKDDYLVVTLANGTVKSAVPATVVENAVVSSARSNDYVVAGGTKYSYNENATATACAVGQSLMSSATSYKLADDGYNLYLDPNGFVLGVEGYDAGMKLDNYLFVKKVSTNGFDNIAKALFADGTTKTITVDKVGGSDTFTWNRTNENQFYTFGTDKDGNYELNLVVSTIDSTHDVAQGNATDKDITATVKPIELNTTQYANANTVFIAKDKAYTGVKNAPKVISDPDNSKQNDVYYLYDKDNRLMLVYGTQSGSVETSVKDMVYILNSNPAVNKEGDGTYYTYDAIVDGAKTTLNVNQGSKPAGLYKVDTYTDGRADLGTAITSSANEFIYGASATAYAYKDTVLTVTGGAAAGSYILKDDVKVFTVNGNTVKTVTPDSLGARTITDGFTTVVMVKEKDEANADIILIYLVKP